MSDQPDAIPTTEAPQPPPTPPLVAALSKEADKPTPPVPHPDGDGAERLKARMERLQRKGMKEEADLSEPVEEMPAPAEEVPTAPDVSPYMAQPMPDLDKNLVQMAQAANVDDARIRQLGSNDALRGFLLAKMEQPRAAAAAEQPAPEPVPAPEALGPYTPYSFDAKFENEDMIEEGVLASHKAAKGMADHFNANMGVLNQTVLGLQDAIGKMVAAEEKRGAAREAEWFDVQVQNLVAKDPSWVAVLGDGPITGKGFDPSLKQNRGAMFQWFRQQRATNGSNFAPEQLVSMSANTVFGEHRTKHIRNQLAEEQSALADEALLPPTSRMDEAQLSGEDKALNTIRRFQTKKKTTRKKRKAKR